MMLGAWWQMEWFRDAPIKRKLLSIGLLTSGLALLLISLILTVKDIAEWRSRTIVELTTYAKVIGSNAAPAMLFDDRKAAADILSALSAKAEVWGDVGKWGDAVLCRSRLTRQESALISRFDLARSRYPSKYHFPAGQRSLSCGIRLVFSHVALKTLCFLAGEFDATERG